MGIFSRTAGRPPDQRGANLFANNPGIPLTSTVLLSLFANAATDANVQLSPSIIAGISAVYRAVALLSGTIASLDIRSLKTGTTELVGAMPSSDGQGIAVPLLEAPHPLYTKHEWIELAMVHLLFWGNFYGLKVRTGKSGSLPIAVTPLMPWDVVPHWVIPEGKRVPSEKLYVWTLQDGTTVGLGTDDIFHVPAMGYNGLVGLPPLELFRQTFGLAIAAEKTGAKFFGSGNLMSGFLHSDKKLTEPQAKALKSRWMEKMSGVQHAGEIAVLDSGAAFTSLMLPPDQAQFLQTREFEVLEISRIFGVPPHLLSAATASTWGTGIEQLNMGLSLFSITPWTSRLEGRFTKELLPPEQYARFITTPLTKGDTRVRSIAHLYARRGHWETINEARSAEGLPRDSDPRADDLFYGEGEPGGVVGGDIPDGSGADAGAGGSSGSDPMTPAP